MSDFEEIEERVEALEEALEELIEVFDGFVADLPIRVQAIRRAKSALYRRHSVTGVPVLTREGGE